MASEQVQQRIALLAERRVSQLMSTLPALTSEKASWTEEERAAKVKRRQAFETKKRREIEGQLSAVARKMAEVSVARLDSIAFIKVFAATINNVLVRMYHRGIHISVPQVLELRRVAAFCAERKYSILFLPCHKSHIDYLTFSWLIFRLGLSLPHIIAGENLDMPVVGNILRGGGAFFIRRTFAGDELYPAVIKEYIEQILTKGKNMECFIEGTRSRTGKLLPPKLGILKYIVDTLLSKRVDDVYICPVSIQYDDVVEAETFVSELLGKPKEAESLLGLLSGSSSLLSLQMGRIDVRFKQPWSLSAFIEEQIARREAPGEDGKRVALDPAHNNDHKILLLRTLGYRVLADINNAGVVMPAALVGTVMLTLRGRGVGHTELVKRVEWLRSAVEKRGYQVADFGQMSTVEVVDRALSVMKGFIEVQHSDVMETTLIPQKRFELSFYRNQVMHIFVSEGLLSVSLYTRIKQDGGQSMQRMSREELQRDCGFISHLLRNEFVFATDSLESNVNRTIHEMCADEVLQVDGDQLIGLSKKQRDLGRRDFDTYLFMIWPFIEGYWLAACSMLLLASNQQSAETSTDHKIAWFAAKEFEKRAQLFGKTMYAQGELSYLEAVSAQTISQAIARYEELGMVQRRKSTSAKPIPLIAIHPDYASDKGAISGKMRQFLERLNTFRREGKDRRDADDVVGSAVLDVIQRNLPRPVEYTRTGESGLQSHI
jgi:glycerol-3-phosphate O-acyltransferase